MNTAVHELVEGLHWREDGCASLSGALLDYADALDAEFRRWADDIGAAAYRFPSLIAAKDLAPIGYLKSFPHLATFVTSADRREISLRALAADYGTADRISVSGERFEPVEQLLTPAACYHFYPMLAGNDFTGPVYLTTNCQCHRREDHYLPLQRQWCFRMREFVCIGDRNAVREFTGTMRARIGGLLAELGLAAVWKTATDPFFDPATDPKAMSQLLEPAKRELRTPHGLAIASINEHRSFFGECYEIRCRGEASHSACVAFGIERWLHAMIERLGPGAASWPVPGEDR